METIRTQWHDGVAVVRLSRPPVNALTLEMVSELSDALQALAPDAPHGLVLTGAESTFCAGVDVKSLADYSDAHRSDMVAAINVMINHLYGFPAPTVAAVNGHAIGAGMVLVLACDVRLGVPDDAMKLGLTEVTAGVSYPAGPMEVVNAELEPGIRRRLVLSGEIISPPQAHGFGLLDGLVEPDHLLETALDLARTRAQASAYRVVKAQLRGRTVARMHGIASNPGQRDGLST